MMSITRLTVTIFFVFATMTVPARAADLTAVVFYADWCGPCQILEPALEQAAADYDKAEIEIVRLDFTDMTWDGVQAQIDIAETYGIENIVTLSGVRTGYALLIIDQQVRGRISAGMDAAMIESAFTEALQN